MESVWWCGGCVALPMHEMRLAVMWAVLYNVLVECVCSVAMLMLCVNLWNGLRAFGGIVVFWWASGNPSTPDLKLVSLRNGVVHVWAWSGPLLQVQLPAHLVL